MTLMSDANAIIRADRTEIGRLRASNAELLVALEGIMQRANERRNNVSSLAMERDTVYAMHEIARAALAKAKQVTP